MTEYERNDAELIRILASLLFGFADKTFKFVSWLVVIAAIQIAQAATGNFSLFCLSAFLGVLYGGTLFFALMNLALSGFPDSRFVPPVLRWAIAASLFIFGMILSNALILPFGNGGTIVDEVLFELRRVGG